MSIRIDGTNTAANPGITGTDTDTGLQFGTDEVSIVTGGEEQVKVDSGGRVLLEKAVRFQYNTDSTDSRTWMMSPDVHGHGNFSVRVSDAQTSTSFDTKFTFKGSGGLCFNGDTSDANALNDYEEGTFTFDLVDAGTGGDLTTTGITSKYVRIGQVCQIFIHCSFFATPGSGTVNVSGTAPFPSADPAVLYAGGPMRGFDETTRDLSPVVVIAGATRTAGGSNFYLHTMDGFANSSGYDTAGGWTRNANRNAPGVFIQGSYLIAAGS